MDVSVNTFQLQDEHFGHFEISISLPLQLQLTAIGTLVSWSLAALRCIRLCEALLFSLAFLSFTGRRFTAMTANLIADGIFSLTV